VPAYRTADDESVCSAYITTLRSAYRAAYWQTEWTTVRAANCSS
jgi:hypothetical protein